MSYFEKRDEKKTSSDKSNFMENKFLSVVNLKMFAEIMKPKLVYIFSVNILIRNLI